jgi:Carboxylesterase family
MFGRNLKQTKKQKQSCYGYAVEVSYTHRLTPLQCDNSITSRTTDFQYSNSENLLYNGARLANNEDVVVVTFKFAKIITQIFRLKFPLTSFSYRMSIFGFPNAPGLDAQNVGLLDQHLAVEWIHNNAAAFGGDPTRIILFRESAGASSVDAYTYAYANVDNPLIAGVIAESGTGKFRIWFSKVYN